MPEPINDVLLQAAQFGKLDTSAPITFRSVNNSITTYAAFTDDGLIIQRPESDKTLRKIFEIIYNGETTPAGFTLSFHTPSLPSIRYVGSPDMDFETRNLSFIEEKFGHKLTKLTMEDISTGCGEAMGTSSLRYKLIPEKGMRLWMGTGVRSLDEPQKQ